MSTHRFRPRYRGVALTSMGLGTVVTGAGIIAGFAMVPIAAGAIGLAFGVSYLTSRSWRYSIVTDDAGLEVRDDKGTRFRLLWTEIRVVASPSTKTCFIDGGSPEQSILIPGVGASAPYAIEDREQLFDTVVARVTPDRVERVETLEQRASPKKPA